MIVNQPFTDAAAPGQQIPAVFDLEFCQSDAVRVRLARSPKPGKPISNICCGIRNLQESFPLFAHSSNFT